MANKIKLRRSLATGAKMPAGTAADVGEIGVNIPDGKIYMRNASGAPILVADRIKDYSTAQAYDAGDIAVRDGVFVRAKVAIAPGAFNTAQWDAIGGGNAQGAIVQSPDTALRNTINLLGKPNYKGLVIQGDSGQTANLLEIPGTAAGDTRGAFVDPTGFPVDRFAVNIFRVVQASHQFLYRGQPAAFKAGQWVPANASNPELVAVAVIEQRIDDNTFVLRTGGRIEQLQASAFSGGSMVWGKVYYVSDTEPGKLTATASSIRPDPVLIYLGSNAGIVVAGTGAAATDYVAASGDTMSGPLTMAGQNEVRFDGAATSIYKQAASPSLLFKVTGVVAGRIDEIGTAAGYGTTLMTRDKGDARYVRIDAPAAGVSLSLEGAVPRLNFSEATGALNAKNWRLSVSGERMAIASHPDDWSAGTELYRFTRNGGLTTGTAVVTREKGDERYLALGGGTVTGQIGTNLDPTAATHLARKNYVDDQVGTRLTQTQADVRYAMRTITLTGGDGIVTNIGNLTANRSISLDLGFTDTRYLRANLGKSGSSDFNGRLNIFGQSASNIIMRLYGTDDAVAFTVTTGGDVGVANDLTAGALRATGGMIMRHTGTQGVIENVGPGHIIIGTGGGPYARIDADLGLAAAGSIVTRSAGDGRYVNESTSWNGVGSTVMARYIGSGPPAPGDTVNGSDLRVSNAAAETGAALPGQWILCGLLTGSGAATNFRRIS